MALDLNDLNEQQRAGVLHGEGPLLVLAGAGTGKTRVITYRIARLIEQGVSPERILAVTFTNKAAGEMRRRIHALTGGAGSSVWTHTFHGLACRLLRRHHALLKLGRYFTIYGEDDQKRTVVSAMRELSLEDQKNKAGMYVHIISRAKDDLLDAGSYAIYAATQADPARQAAARIYQVYQRRMETAGALDFGDLLLKTCELLKMHESVRDYYQKFFAHILVDEYQDTNHAQYLLTKTLAAKHRNLCVVGDDDQGIYSWRGANIRNILEFERDFEDTRVVTLERNYRSTPRILDAAMAVIRNNQNRKSKTLWTEGEAGPDVLIQELPNEAEEARWVVGALSRLVENGRGFADVAVFYRTNAQSRSFEEVLRSARIPYRIVGAMRFYERKEVKDLLAYARAALNPADSAALSRILNVPPRGVGKTSQEALARFADRRGLPLWEAYRRAGEVPGLGPAQRRAISALAALMISLGEGLDSEPPAAALGRLLEGSGLREWLESEVETDPEAASRLGNLQELLNAARDFEEACRRGGETVALPRYLEEVALQSAVDDLDASVPAVTLMTVHLAKGLEYPVVFLTGLEEGLFPIGSGSSAADLEEERRLCYVGMTRARECLMMTHAATRRLFGNVYANLPSRFLFEAQSAGAREAAPVGGAAPMARPSFRPAQRALLGGVRVGMRVRHPQFGTGRVVEHSGAGDGAKVTVRFEDGRTAKLLVRYAPLEPA